MAVGNVNEIMLDNNVSDEVNLFNQYLKTLACALKTQQNIQENIYK